MPSSTPINTWLNELMERFREEDAARFWAVATTNRTFPNAIIVHSNSTEIEGGTMPETGTEDVATIEVLPTYQAQREIFDSLGITQGLIESLDLDNWSQRMEELREGYSSATFNVSRGSYTIKGYPTAEVKGKPLRLGTVSLATAQEIVEVASGGRITVSEVSPLEYRLKTISAIEDAAFDAMFGTSLLFAELDPSNVVTIGVSSLREVMEQFREFRANTRKRDYLRNAIRENLRKSILDRAVPPKVTEWNSLRASKFGEYFENIKKGLVVQENPLSRLDLLPRGVKASRFWGIEPEAVDVAGVDTPQTWQRKGDGSLRGLQYESIPSWSGPRPGVVVDGATPRTDHDDDCQSRVLEDGCTCGECFFDCTCGYAEEAVNVGDSTLTAEFNSPILRSYHSRGLEYLCEKIEYRNTNNTAGVHVHVSAADLTPDQVVQVGLMYTALEPLFRAEYKRTVRNYCKELDLAELVSRFKQAGVVKTMAGTANVRRVFSGDRYFTVNTSALNSHGTIEFRAMGPRYNYEFLIKWAHFLREIVNMAKAEIPQKVWRTVKTFDDLVLLMSKYGKETPTPSWATDSYDPANVVSKLGTEVRRAPNEEYSGEITTVFDDYTGEVRMR